MHEGHRQRVRERFLQEEGLKSFAEHQALELLLFYAVPRRDTNVLAHRLLDAFGSMRNLFAADIYEIMKIEGIGLSAAILIKMIPECVEKYWLSEQPPRRQIKSVADAVAVIEPLLYGKPVEHVYVFCLDKTNALTHFDLINRGNSDSVQFRVRNIVEIALRLNSENIILAHNHPTGNPKPSPADIRTTKQIAAALLPIGIRLVDHLIFADHAYYSFIRQKLIAMDVQQDVLEAAQYSGIFLYE